MFVVMALVTTVATTPLTTLLYPPWYQKKLEAWKRGEIDWEGNRLTPESDSARESVEKIRSTQVRRLFVYLRLDSLPSLFTFITLLGGDRSATVRKVHSSKKQAEAADNQTTEISPRPLEVHGARLLELTERTSSVMKVSEGDEYNYRDPVVNAFRTFAQLNNVAVSGSVSIVPEDSYADTLTGKAADISSDLVLIPWSETGSMSECDQSTLQASTSTDRFSSGPHNTFVQSVLSNAKCNTAIFINRGFGGAVPHGKPALRRTVSGISLRSHREKPLAPIADRSHHIFFPYFGGKDDKVALRFVLQIAKNTNITATILHIISTSNSPSGKSTDVSGEKINVAARILRRGSSSNFTPNTSFTVDPNAVAQDTAFLHALRDSLPDDLSSRVVFNEVDSASPIDDALEFAVPEVGQSPRNAGDLIICGRGEIRGDDEGEIKRTLGATAERFLSCGARASVLVVQAAPEE